MSLMPGEDIPEEANVKLDKFITVVSGKGSLNVIGDNDSGVRENYNLEDKVSVLIPAGMTYYIKNTDPENPLKLYIIYSNPEYSIDRIDEEKPTKGLQITNKNIKGFVGKPILMNIGDETLRNVNFRRVIYLGKSQLNLMSLMPQEYSPTEKYMKVDQFIRVESGEGILTIGKGRYSDDYLLEEGISAVIQAGMEHHIKNTNVDNPLKYYVMYSSPVNLFDRSDGYKKWTPRKILKLSGDPAVTLELIEKHIDQDWNWDRLSHNPNINLEFIDIHSDRDWNWKKLSGLPGMTLEFIENYKDAGVDWDWKKLSKNKNITIEFIKKYIDEDWDWYVLSKNPKITLEFLYENLDKGWDFEKLSENPKITLEFLYESLDKGWDFWRLSENINITPEFIEENIERSWNWRELSKNLNLTSEFIYENLDKDWDLGELSENLNMTPELIAELLHWDWEKLSGNPAITLEFIEKNLDENWDWIKLSRNPIITPEFYHLHDGEDWDHRALRTNPRFDEDFWIWRNKNAGPEFLSAHRGNKEWFIMPEYLSENPNITPVLIESLRGTDWNWKKIVDNPAITPELVEARRNKKFWNPYWVQLSLKQPLIKPAQR